MNANQELVHVGEVGRQIIEHKLEPEYVVPVMDLETAKRRLVEFQEFVRGYLVEGEDYGIIPGTKQRTLLKSGADKLCEVYGLAPTFPEGRQRSQSDWAKDPPYLKYTCTCVLVHKRSQMVAAEGVGSCNSYEKKYKYRWENGKRVINHDIADQDNTLLKMAAKRAFVAATISVTRSSGIFTQDMEDVVDEPKPQRRGRPKPAEPKPEPKPSEPAPPPPPPPPHTPEINASLAGFAGCSTVADVERYWAHEFELAKKAQNTRWMAELSKAKHKRKDEIRDNKPREEPTAQEHGLPGIFPE